MTSTKGMTPERFAAHLDAMEPKAGLRWTELYRFLLENGMDLYRTLGGKEGVKAWVIGQYNLRIQPIDIKWFNEEQEEKWIDNPCRFLLSEAVDALDYVISNPPAAS